MQPNQISPSLSPDGYRILKMISKESAGQREALNDPNVQQSIRENLRNAKDQLLKAAYYEVANSSKIENYLARSIVQNSGQNQ